jgi:antitoxin PrlF
LKLQQSGNTLIASGITGVQAMATTVTAKGQVTIPKGVRNLLGIIPGSKVDFHRASDGSIVLRKVDQSPSPSRFDRLRGHAGTGLGTEAIMAMTRGET